MSNRPQPPLSTDSPEELAHHVAEHASDWMMYLRNLNQYTSTLEEEVSSSQVETLSRNATIASLRSDLTKRDGVISYQKDQYDAAQKEVIRLEIEKLQLLNAATPAVQTPATEPAPTGPRVDRTADAAPGATLPTPVTSTGSAILSEKLPDPKNVFHTIYGPIIRQLRTALAAEAFLSQVESAFTAIVLQNPADMNLTGTCVFCLVRRPIFTLDCQHQLCSCCIIASGATSRNDTCSLSTCPWCGKGNAQLFSLQPPTAGCRILDLGTSSDLIKTCSFLKGLHRNSITALPLRDYFDVVRCDEASTLLLVVNVINT